MSYTNYHIIHTIAAPYVKVINLEKNVLCEENKSMCFLKNINIILGSTYLYYFNDLLHKYGRTLVPVNKNWSH